MVPVNYFKGYSFYYIYCRNNTIVTENKIKCGGGDCLYFYHPKKQFFLFLYNCFISHPHKYIILHIKCYTFYLGIIL